MVHEGNKDEAEKCFKLAQNYFRELNREKALRFAQKANRLFTTERYTDFIDLINRLNATSSQMPSQSNGTSDSNASIPNNVRQRKPDDSNSSNTSTGIAQDYTSDQLSAVRSIKKCKDYYEILAVSKDATDSDLKKSYRKLALQFHPDKNKAPGADEAFKAVGNAFSVLSDPEKRKQYDLYGPDEANSHASHRSSYNHQDYTRGYEGDVTAEELFNMFFGGGYPGGSVYVRRNGRWERNRSGQTHTQRSGHHHDSAHADQSSLSVFLQMMPLLLILVLSLASSFLSSDPVYSLSPTSKYTVTKTTGNLGINFYVKPDFGSEYQGSIRKLEQAVEEDYVASLRNGCYKERNYKENMMWRAKSYGDAHLYRKAQDLRSPSCDALQALYS